MMNLAFLTTVLLSINVASADIGTPSVEPFLYQGQLARGEQVLDAALRKTPEDDQLRFGLGVLQFVRGVEELGQALHEYGCQSDQNRTPFLRLPVPENPHPSEITYLELRRVLQEFYTDLERTEATLAGIQDHRVTLKLRLANIRMNLIGDHQAATSLGELLTKLMGRRPPVLDGNPDFQVQFDRGDVAWLRAYCHLLMAMIDVQLAFDLEASFNLTAGEVFARPKMPFTGTHDEKQQQLQNVWERVAVKEPLRFSHFRHHMLQVCRLNHETWTYVRAEQDDHWEWLPNPRQKGVIGLPVTDEMIQAWLNMMDEMEALLEGRKVIPAALMQIVSPATKTGLNFRTVLEDPPEVFNWKRVREETPQAKYLDASHPDMNFLAFIRAFSLFQNSLGVAYAAWFN